MSLLLGFLSQGLVAMCGVPAVGKLGPTVLLCHPPAGHGITSAVGLHAFSCSKAHVSMSLFLACCWWQGGSPDLSPTLWMPAK